MKIGIKDIQPVFAQNVQGRYKYFVGSIPEIIVHELLILPENFQHDRQALLRTYLPE